MDAAAAYDVHRVPSDDEQEPPLQSVDAAYVLTMHDSERLHDDARLRFLASLCRVTYVQVNQGYRRVPKPGVDSPARDIVHACQHAFADAARRGHHGYVLVLEDDAAPLLPGVARHLRRVDAFLRDRRPCAYTLGSLGLLAPSCTHAHSWRVCGFLGFAQAVVYSAEARRRLAATPVRALRHVDVHFLSRLPRKYAYALPLIVQKLERTDNMAHWGVAYSSSGCAERQLVRAFVACVQRVLRLDRSLRGWWVVYACNHVLTLAATAAALVAIARYAIVR